MAGPGCSGEEALKWQEDVLLSDGQIITVSRYQEFKGPSIPFESPTESKYWLEFKDPSSAQIVRWENLRDLAVIALMIKDGAPELLVMPNFDGTTLHNCPNPPYLLYRFALGKWTPIPLATLRGVIVNPNLTYVPSSAHEEIVASKYHLAAIPPGQDRPGLFSGGHTRSIYSIDFGLLKEQTFGLQCNPPFDWMLVKTGVNK